jgi:hypothetical protein
LSPEKKEAQKEKEKEKDKKRIKFSRHDLVDIFKKLSADNVKPNEVLKKVNDVDVPILELGAKPDLEFINPTVIKRDVKTPKSIPLTPNQQALTPKQQVLTPKLQATK